MLAICQYIMFIKVFKNVAGYHVLLNFATNASEGDRSIVACLELLTLFKDSSYIGFPPILWYIAGIKASWQDGIYIQVWIQSAG